MVDCTQQDAVFEECELDEEGAVAVSHPPELSPEGGQLLFGEDGL
jgi:hypothetical protein